MMRRAYATAGLLAVAVLSGAGCGGPQSRPAMPPEQVRALALRYVTAGATFRENPVIRAQAIEILQEAEGERAVPWFREALRDEHPGVRFAALMALGTLRHKESIGAVRASLADRDPSVRVAAMFALYRLGDRSVVQEWAEIARHNPDPVVRGNAVLAMGRLEDPEAVKLLRHIREDDKDDRVQLQALEAMALLGDRRAVQQLIFYASGAVGDRQTFALGALGRVGDPRAVQTLRYALTRAPHLECRLAAAGALGRLGSPEGYRLALRSLDWNSPNPKLPNDPPANQVMRVRTLAAVALGAIGNPEAIEPLRRRMEDASDPRTQLAAASAILRILREGQASPTPLLAPAAPAETAGLRPR